MSNGLKMRAVITALLPQGAIWKPEPGNGLDQFFDGMGLNLDEVRDYLKSLGDFRNPQATTLLADLEKEYGIAPSETLSEQARRDLLSAKKGAIAGTGSLDGLKRKLNEAGFRNLFVYNNDPEVDPALFLTVSFQCIANNTTAVCGNDAAFCGVEGGELLVNGIQITTTIGYFAQAGEPTTCCDNDLAIAGYFLGTGQQPIEYEIPTASMGRWNLIFYVGGEIDEWNDSAAFARGSVPSILEDTLKTIILQHKPMHSWCALVVDYT
jgi:hypothetical protein